jgi:WD40 repeat protein
MDEKKAARLTLRARVAGPGVNVAFSPDGRRLATGGEENTVKIWDVQNGAELQTLRGHNGDVYTVAFSPDDDGRWVASAGEDSAVKVWDSRTGKLVRSFRGHTSVVTSVAFSPDGRRLVSGSRDHTGQGLGPDAIGRIRGKKGQRSMRNHTTRSTATVTSVDGCLSLPKGRKRSTPQPPSLRTGVHADRTARGHPASSRSSSASCSRR